MPHPDVLEKYKKKLATKVSAGLEAVANHLKERADELVPEDTKGLIGTGKVRPFPTNFATSFTVGYGTYGEIHAGPSRHHGGHMISVVPSQYAVYIHENMNVQHPGGGQAEFLATPLRQDLAEMSLIFRAVMAGP